MKRLLTTTLIALLLLAASNTGRAQNGGAAAQPPPRPAAQGQTIISQGRLEGSTYSNDFFGVSFTIPKDWVTQDLAAKQAIVDRGREIVHEGANEKKKAALDAAMNRTYFLLSASKYEQNAPSPDFNALLMCVAERVPTAVIKTESDYITVAMRTLQGSSAKATVEGPVRYVQIGGAKFGLANVRMTIGGMSAMQRYYVRLMKGHAFVFIYTYVDEQDEMILDEFFKSVKFK